MTTLSTPHLPASLPSWTVLRRDGVSVVVRHAAHGLPSVVHRGADLGELDDAARAAAGAARSHR